MREDVSNAARCPLCDKHPINGSYYCNECLYDSVPLSLHYVSSEASPNYLHENSNPQALCSFLEFIAIPQPMTHLIVFLVTVCPLGLCCLIWQPLATGGQSNLRWNKFKIQFLACGAAGFQDGPRGPLLLSIHALV